MMTGDERQAGQDAGRDPASFDWPPESSPPRSLGDMAGRAWSRMVTALGIRPRGHREALGAFTATAPAHQASGKPTVLLVSHDWGGGVERHLRDRVAAHSATTNFLLLTPRGQGARLSLAFDDGHPALDFGSGDLDAVLGLLRAFPLSRVEVHHVIGFALDVKPIVDGLALPFDVMVHDYFALCPRISLFTPWDMRFCGEPPEALCNRCIASGAAPEGGRGDIATHRARHRWLFAGAARVICPSEDVLQRLARYGITERVVVVPHEPQRQALLRPARRLAPGEPLRVVLLGSLMPHKGLWLVRDTVLAARGRPIAFHLIGFTDPKLSLPPDAAFTETGRYREADLPALIAASGADVAWLPSVAPETYSYTLSAALAAGLPILASDRGAFRERLSGLDWSWLAPAETSPQDMLALFQAIAAQLSNDQSVRTD